MPPYCGIEGIVDGTNGRIHKFSIEGRWVSVPVLGFMRAILDILDDRRLQTVE